MNDGSDLVAKIMRFLLMRRYEHGERMPSERELAERFEVGRNQVREALAYLEALRIVERRAKSGIYLTSEAASVEALALFARIGVMLSLEEVRESVEVRRIHEITAARLASERATLENFDRLRDILAATAEKIAHDEPIGEQDRDFHLEIIRAAKNNIFYRISSIFYTLTERQRVVYFSDPEQCRKSHAEHVKVFEAIARRDATAAMDLMTAHLSAVDSYWRDRLEEATRNLEPVLDEPTGNVRRLRL